MQRFWQKRIPRFSEEDAFYFIKDLLKDYDEDEYSDRNSYARGSSSNRGGGSSSSYHENKEVKLEKLAEVYSAICDFFEEIGVNPKAMAEQGQYRK